MRRQVVVVYGDIRWREATTMEILRLETEEAVYKVVVEIACTIGMDRTVTV